MALFRRRKPPEFDDATIDRLVKAISPAIARAATVSAGVSGATYQTSSSPFFQTSGGGQQSPLPRPAGHFDSQFGAGYPLMPDPLDPLGPNGRTAPRRSQYLVAWNLQLVDRQVPWTMLRWLAEDCDVVNRCIQLTQDEQCGLDWGWSYSPQLLHQIMQETGETNSAKATSIAREKYGPELLKVQQFFESPDGDMNQTFVDWLQALLWDHLVYDGVAVYPRYNMDKSLRNLELIDSSTIKLLRDNSGRIPAPPAPAYQQILYGFPRGEFQHTIDEADDEFLGDQLAYYIRRPRNTSVYGYPQVEEVMALATTYLGRQAWMRAEYTTGVIPKMLVNVKDNGNWTPEQWNQFETNLNDRLSGQIERRQMAFLFPEGADPTWAPQIEETYKNEYDNWLISQIGSRFGRPASMLGVQAKAGLSGGKQMQGEVDQSDIYSGKALTGWLVLVLNNLARRFLGVGPEITATVNGGGNKEDMVAQAQADASDIGCGLRPRNEVRAARGLPLIDEPEADQLSITTGQGVTFLSGLLDAQTAAQAVGPVPPPVGEPAGATVDQTGAPVTPTPPAPSTDTPTAAPTAKAEADHEGSTERLMTYWAEGEGAAKLDWGVPGDFDRCRAELGKYVGPDKLDGLCANLHHRATGAWPGHAAGESHHKAAGGLPKVLADRKTVEAKIVAYYQNQIGSALKGLHPGVVSASRKLATKAAADTTAATDSFQSSHPAQTTALVTALTGLYTDSWVAGLHHATQGPAGPAIATAAAGLVVVPYTDWSPGWGAIASIADPPAALSVLLDSAATTADNLAAGQMTRILNAVGAATSGGNAASAVTDVVGDPDYAAVVATNETANGAEAAASAAYDAAGVQWEWVLDGGACALCQSKAAGGPYAPADPSPPAHLHCGCGSQAVGD